MKNDEKKSIVSGKIYENAYSLDNYIIQEEKKIESKICAIYVSSSGIYYPNTENALEEYIIKKNTFEWWGTRFKQAKKHIFIRDVAKQFYITGINKKINSIDEVITFLENETKGFEIYIIGSSAGGYMASVLAVKLNAKLLICFSGYFNLNEVDHDTWFYIPQYREDEKRRKYFNISSMVNNYKGLMLYFYPTGLENDVLQSKQIYGNDHIYKIAIKSKIHGVPISMNVTKELLNYTVEQIKDKMAYIYMFQNKTQREVDCLWFGFWKGNYLYISNYLKREAKRILNYFKRRIFYIVKKEGAL